ncbi:MAG: tRNA uridine-5-carboxymethylaminomethyl(34) synthesis GTPase MnmE, partial [Clostridia bacterium]|nr:tRNA uridine-5-carboxymethylaminomethyl(34) synthesis GTPase MnmE [Clostridia bacterium]
EEAETDKTILESIKDKELITVYNKADIKSVSGKFSISAKTREGIEILKEEIYSRAFKNGIDLNGEYITEERHFVSLNKAIKYLKEALFNLGKVPLDLIAEDIKSVWTSLGEITGKTASEDIIDEIFAKFCVGK